MDSLPSKIHSTVPVIATDDIDKSLRYYIEALGFEFDFKYGDPPVYAGVRSGEAEIYFTFDPHLLHAFNKKKVNPEVFIWVTDASSLFKEHSINGAEIIEPIADRPWGSRQYIVRDVNGYHLKFAQPL